MNKFLNFINFDHYTFYCPVIDLKRTEEGQYFVKLVENCTAMLGSWFKSNFGLMYGQYSRVVAGYDGERTVPK